MTRLAVSPWSVALAAAGLLFAATTFASPAVRAAGSPSVDLDQWAPLRTAWQNGDLNGNNARFPEGGAVPFRLAIEGLTPGVHAIHLDYDFTAGGHKAYDFLTSWNAWLSPNLCAPSGGAISSLCPALPTPSTAVFPADPFAADGLTVWGAQLYSGAPRRLTLFGGSIVSIGPVVHSGSVNGNSDADMLVRFRATGSAVLLVWAGHLAQSTFWNLAAGGSPDGAGQVSGAPWHMRTLQLDGSGNKNQDRSIQPSAIVGEVPPYGLAPSPTPTPTPRPTPTATPRPTATPIELIAPPRPVSGAPIAGPPSAGSPTGPTPSLGLRLTLPPTATATGTATGREGRVGWALVLLVLVALASLVGATTRQPRD